MDIQGKNKKTQAGVSEGKSYLLRDTFIKHLGCTQLGFCALFLPSLPSAGASHPSKARARVNSALTK